MVEAGFGTGVAVLPGRRADGPGRADRVVPYTQQSALRRSSIHRHHTLSSLLAPSQQTRMLMTDRYVANSGNLVSYPVARSRKNIRCLGANRRRTGRVARMSDVDMATAPGGADLSNARVDRAAAASG